MGQLAKEYFELLKESRGKRAAFAIALSLLAFWIQLLFSPQGTDDDWAISILLSNSYPDSGYSLFIHPWFSAFVSFLFDVLPWGPNYFIIVEIVLSIAATFVILYYAIGHLNIGGALGVTAITVLFGVPYCTQYINFTVVTAILACAGMIILSVQLFERRFTPATTVVGVLFMCLASLLRLKAVALCGPALLVLCVVAFMRMRDLRVGERLRLFVPIAVAAACCLALAATSFAIMQQPQWKNWDDITNPRSDMYDYYPIRPYDEVADQLAVIGVSENDYWMVQNWTANDTGFFTAEKLQEIADIVCVEPGMSAGRVLQTCAEYVMRLGARPYMTLAVVAVLMMLYGAWRRSPRFERLACLAMVVITFAELLFIAMSGRILLRVEYPIWMFSVIALAVLVGAGGPFSPRAAHAATGAGTFAAGALLAFVVTLATYMGAIGSPDVDTVEAIFGKSDEGNSQLLNYQKEHADCSFALDYNVIRVREEMYLRRCLPSREITRATQSMGGWEYGAAFYDEALSEYTGLDGGVMESLAKSDKVYMVGVSDKYAKHVLQYVREHYNPAAEMRVVDEIKDSVMGKTFKVFSFAPQQ
ncbi:MAG: hypothetical protein E7Z99_01095 [Coriobacteriaceae bacterium]|nr:hypothetical protein [Coriobacteriaceae bacterium]